MMEKGKMERGVVELVDTESLVPQEHLLRKVDKAVDFRKLYEIVKPLYSKEEGRPSVDPVVLFKIVLLQHLDGIPSLRGTLRRAQTDIAYRWFLGYTLNEELPHFSTVSYNFRHRHRGNDRGGISMGTAGGRNSGRIVSGGSVYRRHTHQSQRKSEQENQTGSACSGKTISG